MKENKLNIFKDLQMEIFLFVTYFRNINLDNSLNNIAFIPCLEFNKKSKS